MLLFIKIGDDAILQDKAGEIARIVDAAAYRLDQLEISHIPNMALNDISGNGIAKVVRDHIDVAAQPGEQYVTIGIETDNDAFAERVCGECARILREAADKIREGIFDFKLYDLNGNPVGKVSEIGAESSQAKSNGKTVAPITGESDGESENHSLSLYQALVAAGIEGLDSHETDLYVPITPQTIAILKRYPTSNANATRFVSELDKKPYFDIPFAYDPNWARGAKQSALSALRDDIKGKLIQMNAKNLGEAELARVFDGVVCQDYCIGHARIARDSGVTMHDILKERDTSREQLAAERANEVIAYAREGGATLNAYAPGDGSLSFFWHPAKSNALSVPITMAAIKESGVMGQFAGWQVIELFGEMRAIKDIERVNENTLSMDGEKIHYETNNKGRHVFSKTIDGQPLLIEGGHAQSLEFYLKNEAAINDAVDDMHSAPYYTPSRPKF